MMRKMFALFSIGFGGGLIVNGLVWGLGWPFAVVGVGCVVAGVALFVQVQMEGA